METTSNSGSHGIIEQFRLEMTTGCHLAQTSAKSIANFKVSTSYSGPSMKIPQPL